MGERIVAQTQLERRLSVAMRVKEMTPEEQKKAGDEFTAQMKNKAH